MDVGDGHGVSLPEGFSLRSARDEDAERAAELVNEEALLHLGTPIWSTDQVLRHWSNPVVDRERDVAVVEAPGGEICAWLSLVCGPPHVEVFALGVVGLAWHGRGLGAWILAENERRAYRFLQLAPAGARVVIHAGALADDPAVGALLVAAGYREIRRFQLMRVDFAGVPPAPNVPAGIRIDQLDPELDVEPPLSTRTTKPSPTIGARRRRRPKSSGTGSSTHRGSTGSCRFSRGTGRSSPGTCSHGSTRRRTRRAVTSRHSARVVSTAAEGSPRRCCGTSSARCSTVASEAATCTSTRTR